MNESVLLVVGAIALALAALGAAIGFARKLKEAVAQRDRERASRVAVESRVPDLERQLAAAEREVASLARFRTVADAEREAATLRAEASEVLNRARHDADTLARDAKLQATGAISTAEQRARDTVSQAQQQATHTVESARQQATDIVSQANQRAQETAGEALRALAELETTRREARALQNVIEGYGDLYLVPATSVVDDLAEEFGFAEAGAKLKAARDNTRKLLKDDQAAACDYVEDNRRETAEAFVTDAFNGKVDSILSRVKDDNVGTLRQKIFDAFSLVNMNGRAFRNARITDEYLFSRLEELRWAAAAQELKNQERENQRRIKEQIREEEKARREFERAIREAEKEEEAIKKAMDKIQQSVAKASDEQRQRFEAQLAELQQKLQAAEEKNQRALSMAQQTKTGHVYIISNLGSFGEDVFKIGLTRRLEPLDRVRELGDASVPFEFDVHALILSDDAPALEHALHRHFLASQINKVNPRKEFFRVPIAIIRAEIEKLGIQASWTMTAAAAEWKQSLAIEKAIRENPEQYRKWVDKQLVLEAEIERVEERELAEAS